jgi:hypothetical protein
MTEYELIAITISALALFISMFNILLIYKQLQATNISIERDHLRRKREATLNYLHINFPIINEKYWKLKEKYGTNRVWSEDTIRKIRSDIEHKKYLGEILDRIDILSIGIYRGVYSFEIVYDFADLQLLRMHEQLYPVILFLREEYHKEELFESFDALITKIKNNKKPQKEIEHI